MKTLKYLIPSVLGLLLVSGVAYASAIPNSPTLFETYLANTQGSTDTTATLASAALRDGTTEFGYTCLTIDANTPITEYECGTLSGTTFTVSLRGIDAVTGITNIPSLQYAHARGADVKVTDYPALTILSRIFQGNDGVAQPFYYDSGVSTTSIAASRQNVVSVGLLDDTAFNGAGIINATANAKGVVQIATGAQAAASTALGGGSTGASVVLATNIATSTYNSATAANKVVVTGSGGAIDPNFISTLATTTTVATYPILNSFLQRQVFSSTGTTTFSVPSNVNLFNVEVVAGGGAGGGSAACNAVGDVNAAGGGAAGGYSDKIVNLIGTSTVQIFVGSGGTGVSSANGNSGTWSTFGTNGFYISASSGTGGQGNTLVAGGVPGIGTGGDINSQGQGGGGGVLITANTTFTIGSIGSGNGGSSVLGGGGGSVAGNASGNAGGNYGAGGSGSVCTDSSSVETGGAGAQGIVVISW